MFRSKKYPNLKQLLSQCQPIDTEQNSGVPDDIDDEDIEFTPPLSNDTSDADKSAVIVSDGSESSQPSHRKRRRDSNISDDTDQPTKRLHGKK